MAELSFVRDEGARYRLLGLSIFEFSKVHCPGRWGLYELLLFYRIDWIWICGKTYSLKSPVYVKDVSYKLQLHQSKKGRHTRWCSGSRVSVCIPDQPRFWIIDIRLIHGSPCAHMRINRENYFCIYGTLVKNWHSGWFWLHLSPREEKRRIS